MSKIYNEVVIDMNPESPTFEETLYEDSFEYSGDMMLMQQEGAWASVKKPQGSQYSHTQYQFKNGEWTHHGDGGLMGTEYASVDDFPTGDDVGDSNIPTEIKDIDLDGLTEGEALDKIAEEKYGWIPGAPKSEQTSDIPWTKIKEELYASGWSAFDPDDPGIEGRDPMTFDRWMNEMSLEEKAQYILDTKYGADGASEVTVDDGGTYTLEEAKAHIMENQPLKQDIAPEDIQTLIDMYGGSYDPGTGQYVPAEYGPGPDGQYGTEDDPGGFEGQRAGGVYGLAGEAYETVGRTYETAGRTYEGAERTYEGAGRTYETAGMQKETMLSSLETEAAGLKDVGIRDRISSLKKMKKSFETGMDIYGLAGETYGEAGETYAGAGEAYASAGDIYGGAGQYVTDPGPDLLFGTEDDVASSELGTYGLAGERYGGAEEMAGFNLGQGIYNLEYGPAGTEAKWQQGWSTFWDSLPTAAGQ